jgi:hypothetical protein
MYNCNFKNKHLLKICPLAITHVGKHPWIQNGASQETPLTRLASLVSTYLCRSHKLLTQALDKKQGCQIFLSTKYQKGKNIPIYHKIYQMSIKYTKRLLNGPNVHQICQRLPLQGPPKITQIWIFGLKIYHLETLLLLLTPASQKYKHWVC